MFASTTEPYPLPLDTQLPPGVASLAAEQGLGQLCAIYRPKKANWVLLIVMILVFIVMSVALVGLWFLWKLSMNPRLSRKQAAKRVYVFDNGFIEAAAADQLMVYRWDQITTVYQFIQNVRANGVKVATNHVYTVTRQDGATAKLTNFYENIPQLGQTIVMRVAEAHLPHAQAAFDQGQNIQFGDITVNANGIMAKGKHMPWAAATVRLRAGYLNVRQTGDRRSFYHVEARRVPNLNVFLALAERAKKSALTSP